MPKKNVLGTELKSCSCSPMTGWYRDGTCRTDLSDLGMHTVCAVMTEQFLTYSKAQGNDLSSHQVGFPGLKKGTNFSATLVFSPVFGLIPILPFLCLF